jgi:ParB-like chromosome segregation protein Spo0J
MPASRGSDFRPLGGREPADWKTRWSRLESAASDQVILPPVELLRAGGDYWVVDGHNRVALAKELGQLWIDADITELDLGSDRVAASAAKEN